MRVQKSHLRIALFLLGAAVLWAVASYFKPSAPVAAPARTSEPLLASAERGPERDAVDPASIPAPPPVDLTSAPAWRRDPFLFGNESRDVTKPEPVRALSADPIVRSILYSTARRVALVENKIVGIGDHIGAFRVADIERTAVVFTSPTGERRRVGIHGPPSQGLKR
ncbi:MAG: hypothetical protein AB1806_16330 [Acidobacteriota bacterium]